MYPESIEWYKEDQVISLLYKWAPPPLPSQQGVSLSLSSCVSPVEFTYGRRGRGGRGAKMIRRQESLVLNKSSNTLWIYPLRKHPPPGDKTRRRQYSSENEPSIIIIWLHVGISWWKLGKRVLTWVGVLRTMLFEIGISFFLSVHSCLKVSVPNPATGKKY